MLRVQTDTNIFFPHVHPDSELSSPMAMPSSPPRSNLGSSHLRSDVSYGTPRDGQG